MIINNDIILNQIYPIGSIYMSINSTNPGQLFGGTWEALKDRFLIGAGNTYIVNATGGATQAYIQQNQLPSRTMVRQSVSGQKYGCTCNQSGSGWMNICLADGGFDSGKPMGIMNPYLAVYMWKRTA